jgi:hypothetical protein
MVRLSCIDLCSRLARQIDLHVNPNASGSTTHTQLKRQKSAITTSQKQPLTCKTNICNLSNSSNLNTNSSKPSNPSNALSKDPVFQQLNILLKESGIADPSAEVVEMCMDKQPDRVLQIIKWKTFEMART